MKKPRFILSRSKVIEQYKTVEAISDIVSYSSKTNPVITGILEENTDCMFSVHLKNELNNIKGKSRVIFLAQGWDKDMIGELIGLGIRYFTVDNEADLNILEHFLETSDININLLLRMKLKEHSIRTERYFVFGMSSEVINKKIVELKQNKNIEKIGIHFHRKTQNMSEWNIRYELEHSIDDWSNIDIVNIGGGLPSEYANTNVDVIGSIIKKIIELKTWLNEKNISLMVEPGRYIAAPAVKLITNVLSVYDNNIIVDASVYNSDMDSIIVPVKLKVEGELEKTKGNAYVIKGITPCSMDIFRYRVYLNDIKPGDEIIFLNAGAYNFTSDFCELEKIETEVVD